MWVALLLLALSPAALCARVTLPGYVGPPIHLDSGYVEVNATTGRNIFYILSRTPAPNAPLLFWYQGGPGCSGLGGFFQVR